MLRSSHFLFSSFLVSVIFFSCTEYSSRQNPFEVYLYAEDDSYTYELAHRIEGDGYQAYVLRMVSQEWLTPDLVDETEWWHWLTIIYPDEAEHTTGLLWLGGGSRNSELPTEVDPMSLQVALATGSVTAHLHNVPFQPLSFSGDDRLDQRYEDDLIAFGWRQFLESGATDENAVWLSRFPMTKAAMRAMDTITQFSLDHLEKDVTHFVVSGASKRGWTTWTTAIFDDRVVAIAPVVIDVLNLIPSFEHHWQAYGEWSPAIQEYEDEKIMDWQYSLEYQRLLELVDPFSYLDRLEIPKYIINAASDEFFLPDSWKFYWEDLPGVKAIRYVPNAGHSMEGSDAAVSLAAFHNHILLNRDLPQFEWNVNGNRVDLQLDPEQLPDELRIWSAVNREARDFRLYVIDRIWASQTVPFSISRDEQEVSVNEIQFTGGHIQLSGNGSLSVTMDAGEGYKAWFVEGIFGQDSTIPIKLTTGVVVTPDTYPFDPFVSQNPQGTQVTAIRNQ